VAVRDEDYDRAKLLKHEVSGLRRHIEMALEQHAIRTPVVEPHDVPSSATSEHLKKPDPATVLMPDEFASSQDSSHGAVPFGNPFPRMAVPTAMAIGSPVPPLSVDGDAELEAEFDASPQASASPLGLCGMQSPEPPVKLPENHDQELDYTNLASEFSSLKSSPSASKAADVNNVVDSSVGDAPRTALGGVPNSAELPEPEPFAADLGSDVDINSITALIGDYRARCLFSKNWTLREAALAKARVLVDEGHWEQIKDIERLCDIVRIGVHDKIAQVYLTSLALLDDVAHKLAARGLKRADAFPVLEPAIAAVVAKLGDNQPRLREKAVDELLSLSHCRVVGADRVAEKVMRSLARKRPPHNNKWRPIATRLEFLKRLVFDFGVESRDVAKRGPHALVLESIVAFVEAHGCASHTFEEVRTAAKDLIVVIFVTASDADRARLLDPFLEKLRPKQAEEYRSAIDRGGLHDRAHSPNLKDQIFYEGTPRANGPAPAQPLNLDGSAITPIALTVKAPSTGLASNTSPRRNFSSIRGEGDDESQRSDDPEEERFRDQIMKQLEEKAFSVQEAYEILHDHFSGTTQADPIKENVLTEWVNEVGIDLQDDGKLTRDKKLWTVATWLFQ